MTMEEETGVMWPKPKNASSHQKLEDSASESSLESLFPGLDIDVKAGALAANTAPEAETASLEATEWRAGGAGPLLALWNCHPPWTAVAALYLFYTRKKKNFYLL